MLGWLVFCFGCPSIWGADSAPSEVERIETGSLVEDGSSSHWTVVSATSTVGPSTPEVGLVDFARRGNPLIERAIVSANPIEKVSPEAPLWDETAFTTVEENPVPTFWTAPAPATYTLAFKRPIELRFVDLAPPTRKHGFSDFTVWVRGRDEAKPHEVQIRDATVLAGATADGGFRWRLEITPERAAEVTIQFHLGSLYLPRQIFLQDLDLWGSTVEREGVNGGEEKPGGPN